jgi:hypothetical protein
MKTSQKTRRSERGNALFLILIAVALFAALSYAVTQSGRSGSGGTTRETGTINGAQITDFPASVRTAVTRMVLSGGTTAATLDYRTTTDSVNAIFTTPLGGGAAVVAPPANAVAGATANAGDAAASTIWRYKSVPSSGKGYFILGVGTDTANSGRDSFSFIGLTQAACTAVNTGLGVTLAVQGATAVDFTESTAANEGTASQAGGATAATAGATGTATTIGSNSAVAFACFANSNSTTAGPWVYYHALIEQ